MSTIPTIKEDLERRFQSLLVTTNETYFINLLTEYVEYVNKEEFLHKVIEKLVFKERLDRHTLGVLFSVFLTKKLLVLKSKNIKINLSNVIAYSPPLFISTKVNNELGIFQYALEMQLAPLSREDAKDIIPDFFSEKFDRLGTPSDLGNILLSANEIDTINKSPKELTESIDSRSLDLFFVQKFHSAIMEELSEAETKMTQTATENEESALKSLRLITESIVIGDVIFLVLDDHFEMPIRCKIKNKIGKDTYIKKLHDIAYILDVPQKKVLYDKNLADSINNGLFRKRFVAKYMKTNNLKKPTLVQKSESGNILVLKNEVLVKTALINSIPLQFQSLYIDKTK